MIKIICSVILLFNIPIIDWYIIVRTIAKINIIIYSKTCLSCKSYNFCSNTIFLISFIYLFESKFEWGANHDLLRKFTNSLLL